MSPFQSFRVGLGRGHVHLGRVHTHFSTRLSIVRPQFRTLATIGTPKSSLFQPLDTFAERHIGPKNDEVKKMLNAVGYETMDAFVAATVPPTIRVPENTLEDGSIPMLSESELLTRAKELANTNKQYKSYIGLGYHNAVVPPVILRNVSWRCSFSCYCYFWIRDIRVMKNFDLLLSIKIEIDNLVLTFRIYRLLKIRLGIRPTLPTNPKSLKVKHMLL